MVSQASFDYLHGLYENTGIIWIDAHRDVSTVKDNYPNAHAMVLGSLMGYGDSSLSDDEIRAFTKRFEHILVHLDIDVLDAALFHSTCFANKDLVGDGSGSGKMTIEKLADVMKCIADNSDVVGLTIAEYLPFDEHKLRNMFSKIKLLTE